MEINTKNLAEIYEVMGSPAGAMIIAIQLALSIPIGMFGKTVLMFFIYFIISFVLLNILTIGVTYMVKQLSEGEK